MMIHVLVKKILYTKNNIDILTNPFLYHAAIDEITSYDDTDSEEDYIGTPFYLDDDNEETNQSRHIRLKLDKVPSKASVATATTTDSEASVYFRPECILSPSLFPNVPPYLNFTSHADKGPTMPAALHRVLKWKLSPVMPKIVKRVVLNSGFRIIKSEKGFLYCIQSYIL